ncbi:hypothetical protein EKN19_17775 [Klebsiella pneumoniae]|nr:hypothetical protein [Klebsiella pneumoniae]
MTGCWSGKVAGHCLNILIFMSFIIRFNITYIKRTNAVSTKRYCRLSTIPHASCTLSLHFAQHRTAILYWLDKVCNSNILMSLLGLRMFSWTVML